MEKAKDFIVDKGRNEGKNLRLNYGKNTDKLSGISYRLLNALKVNDTDAFMDTVLNCYLYVKKSVPPILLEVLKDDDSFKTIGYAFISGLIEGKENNIQNKEEVKDDK